MLTKPTSFSFIPAHLHNEYLNLCHCGTDSCPPGVSHGPLVKDYYLIHYVLSGTGTYTVGNIRHHLGPGSAFLIRPGQTVLYSADHGAEWKYAFFAFNGSAAEQLISRTSFESKDVIRFADESFYALIEETAKKLNSFPRNEDLYAITQLMRLFLCLAEHKGDAPDADFQPIRPDIQKVLDYLSRHYTENVTVSELSRMIALDRSYFCRLFKKAVGLSPKQYLIEIRLDRARFMLTETDLPVTRIASMAGFQSFPSFSQLFMNKFQQSPKKYREIFLSEKQDTLCLGSR